MRLFKFLRYFGHGSLVFFFLAFPILLFYETRNVKQYGNPVASPYYWLFTISFIALFYGFTYYVIPRFLLKKKYVTFAGLVLLLFAFFFLLKPFDLLFGDISHRLRGKPEPEYDPFTFDILTIVVFFMVVALGLSIQIAKQWQISTRRALQAETDKANAELAFLKAQVNPHFLFNTLNTIYTLILTKNELAGDAVMKLSNIMRYITDDATADFVTLEKEVAFVTDFINLQRLQHGKKVEVDFSVSGNLEDKRIAPLILLTYIENAFKYGLSTHEKAQITVRVKAGENEIDFFCQNRIFNTPRVTERTGIGLLNTQKRLDFLYPNKHTLTTSAQGELYTVTLKLATA